ncbi:methyltransferase domain-containing protein [Microbacterium sp. RG1]|uniref:methyltransferase domain-containing protein n=1 Tax=Microbacterium sp. RG1 TaxID=2489212 RepID=UPI003FD5939D
MTDTGEGEGRRREWRAASERHSWVDSDFAGDEDARTALAWLSRDYVRQFAAGAERWLDAAEHWPAEWVDVLGLSDGFLTVTPEQTAAFSAELAELMARYRDAGAADPRARRIHVTSFARPLDLAGHGPDLVSAVVGQARLRSRAAAKFGPFAGRMLFTPAGLEQATRLSVAARHAGRFRDAGRRRIADLGCGIGGDTLGFAALGLEVTAVDADEPTAAVAAYNLAPFGDTVTVSHARAEDVDLADRDAVWLDPARRPVGGSHNDRLRADEYSPALSWAFEVAARIPTGIKLGPASIATASPTMWRRSGSVWTDPRSSS